MYCCVERSKVACEFYSDRTLPSPYDLLNPGVSNFFARLFAVNFWIWFKTTKIEQYSETNSCYFDLHLGPILAVKNTEKFSCEYTSTWY